MSESLYNIHWLKLIDKELNSWENNFANGIAPNYGNDSDDIDKMYNDDWMKEKGFM